MLGAHLITQATHDRGMSTIFSLLSNGIMQRHGACIGAGIRFARHGVVKVTGGSGNEARKAIQSRPATRTAMASGLTVCFDVAIDCQPLPVVDWAGSAAMAH